MQIPKSTLALIAQYWPIPLKGYDLIGTLLRIWAIYINKFKYLPKQGSGLKSTVPSVIIITIISLNGLGIHF